MTDKREALKEILPQYIGAAKALMGEFQYDALDVETIIHIHESDGGMTDKTVATLHITGPDTEPAHKLNIAIDPDDMPVVIAVEALSNAMAHLLDDRAATFVDIINAVSTMSAETEQPNDDEDKEEK